MSHCANCGAQVTSGAHYCTSCGAPVEGALGGATTQTRRPSAETLRLQEQRLLSALRQATLGEYEVLGEIGKGGMAVVYLAHDLSLDRKVAVKVMSPLLQLTDPGVQERFKREARTAAQLSHPNIIPVYAVKQSGELVYFVMKYIQGRSLEAAIRDTGAMPIPVVRTVLAQVGSALGHAHRNGVVHRDMKPGNVMLDENGWVAVTDFGIAKVAHAKALTQTGGMVGTPAYMSPEQCAGGEVTGASDQYSLGIMAYEMLSGRQPFSGATFVNLIYDHCHTPPPPLLDYRPDCPPEIAAVVMRMLEKNALQRFPTVEDAVAALGHSSDAEGGEAKRQILTMAQAGSAGSLLAQFPTPGSPVPVSGGHQQARGAPRPPATRVSALPPVTAGPGRRPSLWWAAPVIALTAMGGIWMAARQRGSDVVGAVSPAASATAPAGPAVARLDVAPLSVSLAPGAEASFRATGRDSAGDDLRGVLLTWESSNPQVATVSAGGVVRGVSAGVAQVTVRSGTSSAAAVVTVTPPALKARLPERVPPVASVTQPQSADTTATRPAATVAPMAPEPGVPVAQPPAADSAVRDAPTVTVPEAPKAAVPGPPLPPVDPRPEIERVLETYRRAIESRDLTRLRAAYPGLTPEQERPWRDFFDNVTELTATLSLRDLQVSGDRAQASVAGTYEFRSGSRQTQHVQFVAGFERGPAGWRLVTIK